MLVQGDRLNIINIKGVIDTIFSNSEHDRRKQSIANAALGVINSASLIMLVNPPPKAVAWVIG